MNVLDRLRTAKKIGFLFCGGSARTVFQIGVIETLYALGIHPSLCAGVSAGSWNAACVAVGNWRRLRPYWRFFCRMPYVDLGNLLREQSPFIWPRIHRRAYDRYIGNDRIHSPDTLPLFVALTRLRDRAHVMVDARAAADPFQVLLASNYLPPFYTRPIEVNGEIHGDGGFTNNIPYEFLFEQGCDAVVLMSAKGESEGGLYRNARDYEHTIPAEFTDRVIVIRPRHRLPLGFVERRWSRLAPIADLGALRTREVLLGERHDACELGAGGTAWTLRLARLVKLLSWGQTPT